MRCRLTLITVVAFLAGCPVSALAQVAPGAGTGLGPQYGITTTPTPLVPRARTSAGTGGIVSGNVTGGTVGTMQSGTGGILDATTFGASTGGIIGSGRGQSAGTGGITDQATYGRNTGGITGSQTGAGTGGIGDLNSLGSQTGGLTQNGTAAPPSE
jgi:hypothetical protein